MLLYSCEKESEIIPGIGFKLLSPENSGINFINALEDNPLSDRNILSYDYYFNGAGLAIVDINNDGFQDIFFAGNEVDNRLYLNKGELKFEDITEHAGINENKNWASGVTIVDINGDGFKDIYVCQNGPYKDPNLRRNLLYVNNQDLTFSEKAKEYGLDDGNLSTQAVFFDYDKDGDLDCYVMNESKYTNVIHKAMYDDIKIKKNLLAASGHLYKRNENGKYNQVTEKAGMLKLGFGLGLSVSDFNNDNWPDVYVANDYSIPDYLYINQKDGTFKESIKEYTKQISFFGMGCDAADFNNDGLIDLAVVDMAAQDHVRAKTLMESMDVGLFRYYIGFRDFQYQYMYNSLQLNNGDGTFSNIANFGNIASSDWSWSSVFSDVDLDGDKDLFVTNGYRRYARDNDFRNEMRRLKKENGGSVPMHLREGMYKKMPELKLANLLYMNDGELSFKDMAIEMGLGEENYSYGAAFSDLDNDGDEDIIVNNIDQIAMVWENNASLSNNYLKITLNSAQHPNRVFNSKVYVYHGDDIQMQEYSFVRGYVSHMEESLIFGLGKLDKIDSLKIIWPDDNIQLVNNIKANQHLNIEYKVGEKLIYKQSQKNHIVSRVNPKDIGIDFTHVEDDYDDFARETLLPHKQSTLGPALAEADVNNDGLTDFYIGGAKGNAGALYFQQEDGHFIRDENPVWNIDFNSEDVDALFLDLNKDGWQDLFVLSGGGGEFINDLSNLNDRFYANTGGGQFAKVKNVLPENQFVSSKIKAIDFDNDGDEDLFIGGGSKPGNYPANENSYLLKYENNSYVDVSMSMFKEGPDLGIVKDCEVSDVNGDGLLDLIVVGEWTGIQILINDGESFTNQAKSYGLDSLNGWWYSITAVDYDEDGDEDYILGNMSKNYKHHVSKKKPLYLFYNDFDDNGVGDIVLSKKYKNELVPARGKECSTGQMPFLADKIKTYDQFATSNIFEIYGNDKIDSSKKLMVNTFESIVLINEGGEFRIEQLPLAARLFPILDVEILDLDGDTHLDLILVGNVYNTEVETPRVDSGNGLILMGKGEGNYEALSIDKSGFKTPYNVKNVGVLQSNKGYYIIAANNNGAPQFFKLDN